MLIVPVFVLAQQRSVTVHGIVRSEEGEPLLGALVSIKSSAIGTVTSDNGGYRIENASPGDVMVVSYVGFVNQEFTLSADALQNINVTLGGNVIDDVVVVAFGTQKKESIVSSISTVTPSDLKVPSSNLTTALAGRVSGLIAYQRSGEPGRDGAEFFIRGVTTFGYKKDPLILIDGIETSSQELARLQPDDIEGFSILKDATAAALYGSRGANGVIQVQTKTGEMGRARVALRVENSWSMNTSDIDLADPITFMEMANEAARNSSLLMSSPGVHNPVQPDPYSQMKIDQTKAGADPYRFPAVDWYGMLMKKATSNQRVNMSVSGGGNVARYYVSGTFNRDNGNLNVDERNNFNSNINLKSYQVRSNVNINLTKTTEMIVRASGSFDDYIGPRDGGEGTYRSIMSANPVLFPAYYPADKIPTANHILFGNALRGQVVDYVNPYAEMVSGYKESSKSLLDMQLEAKQDFSFFTEGLKARVMFNTSRYSYFDLSRSYTPYYYNIGSLNTDGSYNLGLINQTSNPTEYLNYYPGSKDVDTTTYIESAVDYNRTFNEKHAVGGLLIYYLRNKLYANKSTLQESLPFRNQGLSGRFTYGYDGRYLVELNFGYNGSERFHRKERYGFFPAAGVAWIVSNENFWNDDLRRKIHNLKLRASYGVVGNDQIGEDSDRFFYLSVLNMAVENSYQFGELMGSNLGGTTDYRTIRMERYANDDISWERSYKMNFALELGLFNCVDIELEYFREKRNNILMTRSAIPSTMGLSAPVRANFGAARGEGVDASIDVNKAWVSGWWLQSRVNFTYATSKYLKYEEPDYAEKYKSRIGWSLDQWEGYIAERLFIDQADVDNSPVQNFGQYGPGDIKYSDVNGDGQITELDRVPLGHPTRPEIVYGFGFSFGKDKWDFSAFFQGSARSSFWINAGDTAPFVHDTRNVDGQQRRGDHPLLQAYADSHWSESNRNIYALWPRLSSEFTWNNMETSTWFMRNGAFLRLKNVEAGYTFDLAKNSKTVKPTLRVYASGTNLFLISAFKLWDVEMGGNGLGYPLQRTFNIGAQLNF